MSLLAMFSAVDLLVLLPILLGVEQPTGRRSGRISFGDVVALTQMFCFLPLLNPGIPPSISLPLIPRTITRFWRSF